LPDYIGECILKIASRLSYRPNFANYPYRKEDGKFCQDIVDLNFKLKYVNLKLVNYYT